MRPNKKGQIAKFHTPLPDEDPNQLYVILDLFEDTDNPRAHIKPLNTGFSLVSINTVSLEDLDVVEVNTQDLIGQLVTINKSDYSQAKGKIIKVDEQKIMLDLTKGVKGVETNVWVTIIDENNKEQMGTLFVDMQTNTK